MCLTTGTSHIRMFIMDNFVSQVNTTNVEIIVDAVAGSQFYVQVSIISVAMIWKTYTAVSPKGQGEQQLY